MVKGSGVYRAIHASGDTLLIGTLEQHCEATGIQPASVRARARKKTFVRGVWLRETVAQSLGMYIIVGYRLMGASSFANLSVALRDNMVRQYFRQVTDNSGYWTTDASDVTIYKSADECQAMLAQGLQTKMFLRFGEMYDIHAVPLMIED